MATDKRESHLKALGAIKAELHEKFPEQADRLAQLDSHIGTVAMVIDHIHDEAARAAASGG